MARFRLEDLPEMNAALVRHERPMADPSPNTKLPLELLRQIDGLCSKYEAALRAGKRPDPAKLLEHLRHPASKSADFPASRLRELPQARRKLLHELLLLELEYHAPTEHDGVIAEWIQRFPNYIDVIARAAAPGDASNRGVHGQGRTASLRRQPGGSVTSAPHESLPPTMRPEGMRVPKNPPAAPRLPETVDYSPRLGTEEPVPKTVPPLSPTQPPENGPCAISGSSGSSPNQQEGAPPMRSIGRFQLLGAVGQGSFGTVYRAYDPVLDREVALKMPKFIGREQEQIKRFLTEAKAAARLRHPNIVAVFEAGEADGVDYIATEFVCGEPLSRRLRRERPTFRQAAQWVRDLALALEYAHSEGVIHRDIKPDNIMIGDSQRPQLMDFGLAKVLAASLTPFLLGHKKRLTHPILPSHPIPGNWSSSAPNKIDQEACRAALRDPMASLDQAKKMLQKHRLHVTLRGEAISEHMLAFSLSWVTENIEFLIKIHAGRRIDLGRGGGTGIVPY
jgi:hypothetical protein